MAQLVFDDPFQVSRQDRVENSEEHIRIMSTRLATRDERKRYEEGA
jgi:uncharacterized DUF497 family protein